MSLTLAATQTIAGVATSASAVTYTLLGDEITGTTDAYKVLAQGQLANSAATIYTATAVQSLVKTILLANTTGAAVTVTLYINGTGAANQIATLPIPAGGEGVWAESGWAVFDSNGARLGSAVPGANSVVNAMLAQMAAHTYRGNNTGSTATPLDVTAAQVAADLPAATSSLQGMLTAAMFNSINNDAISLVNILDYGADRIGTPGTETTNATAWTNALAALPATGGVVYFPFGTYNFNTTLNPGGKSIRVVGDNWAQSIIQSTHTSNDIFLVNAAWNCGFENIMISGLMTTTSGSVLAAAATVPVVELSNFPTAGSASYGGTAGWVTISWTGKSAASGAGNLTGCTGVTAAGAGANVMIRTGGYGLNLASNVNYLWASNVKLQGMFNGIYFASALGYLDTIEVRAFRNNAVYVDGNNDKFINRLTTATAPIGLTSLYVNQTSSLLLQQCQILNGAVGLDLNPPTGVTVPSVEAVNCFFDNNTIGLRVNATGTGSIYRSKFSNCWFSSSTTAGVQFNTVNFDGFSFVNCDFYGNGKGIDASVVGGGHWMLASSRMAQNTTAIHLGPSAAHFPMIIGNEIGPTGAFGVNTTGITVIAGTYKGCFIQGNAVINNTTNATLGAVTVAAGEASWYKIVDNAGINPLTGAAVTTPAVPASTTVVTNTTGRRVQVFIKWGATTLPTVVTVNGVAVTAFIGAVSTVERFVLEPGGTIAVTYTIAFTWVWVGN